MLICHGWGQFVGFLLKSSGISQTTQFQIHNLLFFFFSEDEHNLLLVVEIVLFPNGVSMNSIISFSFYILYILIYSESLLPISYGCHFFVGFLFSTDM